MKFIYLTILIALAAASSMAQDVKKFKDDSEVPRMTIEEAKKEFDAGTAVIVDARSVATYEDEHIKGAINVPIGSPSSEFDKIPKGKNIVVYCGWPNEHTSASLAFQMNQKGIPNVYALKGGIQGWREAKYPITRKGDKQ